MDYNAINFRNAAIDRLSGNKSMSQVKRGRQSDNSGKATSKDGGMPASSKGTARALHQAKAHRQRAEDRERWARHDGSFEAAIHSRVQQGRRTSKPLDNRRITVQGSSGPVRTWSYGVKQRALSTLPKAR